MDWETVKLVGAIIMFVLFILIFAGIATWIAYFASKDGR